MPRFNLGRKRSELTSLEEPDKNKIHYPSIYIDTDEIKGLDLKMGEKVNLVGVVAGRDEHKRDDEKKKVSYNIDIQQLNKGYTEEEYSKLSDEEKDDADAKDLEEKNTGHKEV